MWGDKFIVASHVTESAHQGCDEKQVREQKSGQNGNRLKEVSRVPAATGRLVAALLENSTCQEQPIKQEKKLTKKSQ
jgi:hypothetical protein